MKLTRERLLRGAFHAALLGLIGYLVFGFTRPSPATVAVDDQTYRITGPYAHENLAVYLIHADTEDERQFITLDEGLKSGAVKVSEKGSAQVNELTIDNTGDDYLFLQEGDRVKGGQQDRTIYTSLVIPPHSGQMPLPAFCVEPSRWVAGAKGMQFGGTANPALCPKEVRLAAKVGNNQGQVWAAVAAQKQVCTSNALAPNTNSSLNESLDAPKVKRIAEEFAQALNGVIEEHEDAIGVAIVINGQVEEVNFYPNHRLLGKQYPRLVQSYSLAATLKQKDAAKSPTLSAVDVGRFVWASEQDAKKAAVAATGQPANAPAFANVQYFGQSVLNQVNDPPQTVILGNFAGGLQGQAACPVVRPQGEIVSRGQVLDYIAPNANQQIVTQQFQTLAQVNPFSNVADIRIAVIRNVRRSEAVNKDNQVEVVEQAAVVNCKTEYHGKLVHRQYLRK